MNLLFILTALLQLFHAASDLEFKWRRRMTDADCHPLEETVRPLDTLHLEVQGT